MKDKQFDINLNKVIGLLPEYEPDKRVWKKIESQLKFDERLDKEITKLPEYEYKPDIWKNIEIKIAKTDEKATHFKFKKLIIYSLSSAAVVVLIIGFSSLFNNKQDEKITYSQEEVVSGDPTENIENEEPDPIKFLEESCASVPEVCNSPEFIEQKQQLIELNTEYKKITEVIKMYGESPELVKSLIKIENLKSEILKDLIKTMNS